METKTKFVERLAALGVIFDKKLTAAELELYWQYVRDFPSDVVLRALEQAGRECRFFPRPVDLMDRIRGGTPKDLAHRAAGELERMIYRHGPYCSLLLADRAMTATIRDLGGWEIVCDWSERDWPFRLKEFRDIYEGYVRHGVPESVPLKLVGAHERDNRSKGLDAWIPAPKVIESNLQLPHVLNGKELQRQLEAGASDLQGEPEPPWDVED